MRLKKYLFLLCIPMSGWAQQVPSTMLLQDGIHHWNLLHPNRSYMRYAETDYENIADNLIAYQNLDGGWLKNIDWLGVLNSDSVKATLNDFEKQSTLDNRNTFSQIEYLADTYVLTNKLKYRLAVEKGLDYLLDTQKENVFKKENSIIFQLSQIKKENLDQIELFNYTFEKFGISLEYQNLIQHDTFNLIINYDTNKIKRGAGRKQKTDINKEKLTLREVEELLKTETAETVSKRLGMSRATFFRRLKKNRELGNLEKRFF